DEDPAEIFLDAVPTLLAAGRAHIASRNGGVPCDKPATLGWRKREHGEEWTWEPQGKRIGWVAEKQIWLLPDVAIGEVDAMLRDQGRGIRISRRTLGRRLREAGKLIAFDDGTFTKVVRIDGSSQRVFVVDLGIALDVTRLDVTEYETPF